MGGGGVVIGIGRESNGGYASLRIDRLVLESWRPIGFSIEMQLGSNWTPIGILFGILLGL